jgi:L-threonylcarbamoyladenylate synthase
MIVLHAPATARPDHPALQQAAAVLRADGLVAFPTETVYGLGARADHPEALARIFAAKGRPAYNPLIVHVRDAAQARGLTTAWPAEAERLAQRFWPGPLTLVLPRDPSRVPDLACAGGPTVALRAPAHPLAQALLAATNLPLAAPSANRFQQLSPTRAAHVVAGLGDRVDLLLDGGPCDYGIESTVLDLSGPRPTVLRLGALPLDALRAVLPHVAVVEAHHGDGEAPSSLPSPGMLRKHYAPRARLLVALPEALDEALSAVREGLPPDAPVALVSHRTQLARQGVQTVNLPDNPRGYAAALFAALHDLDAQGVAAVVVEAVPEAAGWEAVRDRLGRAAS